MDISSSRVKPSAAARLAERQDQPTHALAGVRRVRVHRPHPRRILRRIEQIAVAARCLVAAVEGRAAAPATAAGNVAVRSTTKYVPSSISWVSIPMIARLDSICASSRKPRCSSAIAASINEVSTGTSALRRQVGSRGGHHTLVLTSDFGERSYSMQKRLVTRYATQSAEAADENQRRVEGVFDELNANKPDNVSYIVLRLADDSLRAHPVPRSRRRRGKPDCLDGLPSLTFRTATAIDARAASTS